MFNYNNSISIYRYLVHLKNFILSFERGLNVSSKKIGGGYTKTKTDRVIIFNRGSDSTVKILDNLQV
jgi:hypothetical protein